MIRIYQGVPCGTNSEKKMEAVAPETDHQHDTEAEEGQKRGERDMARHGERMPTGHDTERKQADQVGKQQEHEQREDVGDELLALRPDVRLHHIHDEAGHALDRGLPAAGDQLALHSAQHEQPQQSCRDEHEQSRIGEADIITVQHQLLAKHRLDQELMHRIDVGSFSRHSYTPAYASGARITPGALSKSDRYSGRRR
jgi:hypothetical protein